MTTVNTTLLAQVLQQDTRADNAYNPAGVPSDYSWYGGATGTLIGSVSPPSGWGNIQQWGLVEQENGAPASANAGSSITVADMNVWLLLNTGAWVEVQAQATNQIFGGHYSSDFATNNSTPMTRTQNADGSVTFDGPPAGENDHFFHGPVGSFTPGSVVGVFEEMNIKESPGADLVAQVGADWYGGASGPVAGALESNWVLLTDQYQTVYATSLTAAQLTANPPPPLQESGTPTPTPTLTPPVEYTTDAQLFDVATGHLPSWSTLESIVGANMSQSALVDVLVSSSTYADVNHGGKLVHPNGREIPAVIDSLFQHTLGHLPSKATLDGFHGMTNAQAFESFAMSPTVTHVVGVAVNQFLNSA